MHRSHSLSSGKAKNIESEFDDMDLLAEKYKRLLESHHKLLRVNQNLEDKLLRVVSNFEDEKHLLRGQINELTENLVASQSRVEILEHENRKYREDCLLAVELLRCNPSNFVDHDFDSLPPGLRSKLSASTATQEIASLNEKVSLFPESRPGSDIAVYPLPFPPSAVMVPTRKENVITKSQSNCSPGHSRRVSAGSIASIIDQDLQNLTESSNCDFRSRPTVNQKENTASGRILHV